jgi:hypothetical protein
MSSVLFQMPVDKVNHCQKVKVSLDLAHEQRHHKAAQAAARRCRPAMGEGHARDGGRPGSSPPQRARRAIASRHGSQAHPAGHRRGPHIMTGQRLSAATRQPRKPRTTSQAMPGNFAEQPPPVPAAPMLDHRQGDIAFINPLAVFLLPHHAGEPVRSATLWQVVNMRNCT